MFGAVGGVLIWMIQRELIDDSSFTANHFRLTRMFDGLLATPYATDDHASAQALSVAVRAVPGVLAGRVLRRPGAAFVGQLVAMQVWSFAIQLTPFDKPVALMPEWDYWDGHAYYLGLALVTGIVAVTVFAGAGSSLPGAVTPRRWIVGVAATVIGVVVLTVSANSGGRAYGIDWLPVAGQIASLLLIGLGVLALLNLLFVPRNAGPARPSEMIAS